MKAYMASMEDALRLEQLRKDYLAGEPGAGEQLGAALTCELRGFLCSSDADEVIQETLVRVWKALPVFKPETPVSFRNWVYVIACRARRELRQRKVAWISEAARQPDPSPSPSRWMLQRERERRLESAIAKLSSRLAQVFAFVREGGKIKDFAAVEGLPLRTAYSRVQEALRKLRAMLRTWVGAQT
ncbi:MAG: sigma-70 family RNA polymerase sigma factor [Acidobacteria bacterium]|nr:sigma-70 family RNA polymerase sigma factor [Acidobacteriota bacterium]